MAFELIKEEQPSYSVVALAVIVVLVVLLVGVAIAFAYLLISGKGSDYLLGALLGFEFLIAGLEVIVYGRFFVPFREVSEDRSEELLW